MLNFNHFISFFNSFFGNYSFLLSIEIVSLCIKSILLFHSIKHFRKTCLKITGLALICAVSFSSLINIAWIIKLLQLLDIFYINNLILTFVIRISWAGNILFYQSLLIFLESLLQQRKQKVSNLNILLSVTTILLSLPMILLAVNNIFILERPLYEFKLMKILGIYCYIFVPLGISLLIYKIYRHKIPKILKNQVTTIILGILIPELFLLMN
jgi:hypothetical protein